MRRVPLPLKARGGKKSKKGALALQLASAVLISLYLLWVLAFPHRSGAFGQWLAGSLASLLGLGAYALALAATAGLARHLLSPQGSGPITLAAGGLAAVLGFASLAAVLAEAFGFAPPAGGGLIGSAAARHLSGAVGRFFAGLLSLAGSLLGLQVLMDLRWRQVLTGFSRVLAEDFQNWQRSRKEWAAAVASAPMPMAAKTLPEGRQDVVAPATTAASKPVPIARESAPRAEKPAPPPPPPPPADSPFKDYKLPSLDLLRPKDSSADRGKPQASEINAAVESLERTLASFGVQAKVTGYAPGPVITRYELSPAPGVKVSSIVALEADIALAMKAKGIRIIAPIPGKAAVGIEIPNARPAHVGLKELLESPALANHGSRLSFAVGLSADGEELAADLQKMPHLLVAGATNSGKSVLIHSLILSMLFRSRPDEVKFVMIDPKRLELTFYEGIPHLFDPINPPEKAAVVTNGKEAAKVLNAMVRLMEHRYEKFQLFGVRNIDSYNAEADKRGAAREYFIVVVIDELADLMLISRDQVEDSIQRLAQMARAVGIHLVLATQRPSVDVITGVIKANLPSRIALQVISRIDSKVILDGSGAESLQGRGDLLYLAAGAQKPVRGQGAYVSEEEIRRVADALRALGKPAYALSEAAPKPLEADLKSFGVEPLEFSQALKLVLERRRVSQDLLKSQFGSSARATNLLSLLEVKAMIHKPEGSNRWEINFDMIEDYLRTNFPQVPIDKPD